MSYPLSPAVRMPVKRLDPLYEARRYIYQGIADYEYDRCKHDAKVCLYNGNLADAIHFTKVCLFIGRLRRFTN